MTRKRSLWNEMLPLLIVLLVAVITIGSYLLIVSRSVWKQTVANSLEVTEQGGHAFDIYMTREVELVHYLALQYSQMDSKDVSRIQHNIESLNELNPDYFVIDLDSESIYYNHAQEIPDWAVKRGIKPKDYWNDVWKNINLDKYISEEGCVIDQPHDSDYTGVRVLSCYEIFHFADGKRALIQSEHRVADIVNEFSLSFFNGAGFSNIINGDGKIMIRSNNINNNRTFNNIFDIIDVNGNDNNSLQDFRKELSDRKSGVTQFMGQDKEEYIYTYVPLLEDKVPDWYFISVIPNSVIMQHTRSALVTPELIWLSIILCLIIIAVVVLQLIKHNRLIAQKQQESEFIIKFMSDISTNTNAVFIMLDPDDYSVEYVSRNTERMLGVPASCLETDLHALDADGCVEGVDAAINFDLFGKATVDEPVSFEITRKHSISGEILNLRETIYRITEHDIEHLVIVISERTKRLSK